MKKGSKITIIICLIVIIIAVGGYFGVKYFLDKDLEKSKQELQETIEKYGYVEKETVATMIAKFNTEIMDGGINTPATDSSMVIENNLYWYALTENVSCYVKSVEFSEKKEQDVVDMIALYCDKEGYNENTAMKYAKKLIKANNSDLTEEEIDNLIKEAKTLSANQQMANNGKGISIGIVETDNHYEYQVKRLYK